MLDKKRGYAQNRPFYLVDPNANIMAGMVAFLAVSGGVTIATTAASGTVPIGFFWKDRSLTCARTTVETGTFSAAGTINLTKGNVVSTGATKVTNAAGTVVYTDGTDYTVNLVNGIITNLGIGIPALASVVIWYPYNVSATAIAYDYASSKWSTGSNYDRQPDDTLGSSKITVVEGWAHLYTDMYDPTQTYTMNAHLQSDVRSLWTTAVGVTNPIGRVIKVPTATDPFLGVTQIPVVV